MHAVDHPRAALERILRTRVPDQADAIMAELTAARRAYERAQRRRRDQELVARWDAMTPQQQAERIWRRRQVENARRRLAEQPGADAPGPVLAPPPEGGAAPEAV